jgi:hypothetical protein
MHAPIISQSQRRLAARLEGGVVLQRKRLAWMALLLIVLAWLGYTVHQSVSFQECLADKQRQQIQEETEKDLPNFARQYVVAARVNTECLFYFLYDNRDAVTAFATAFIAIFTFTLWWATWSLLRHGREVERAYVSGGGPLVLNDPNTLAFTVDNYGKTPAIMQEYAVEFCPLNAIPPMPAYNAPNYQRTTFHNRIRPGTSGLLIAGIPIPTNIPRPLLAYGRYWFLDIWKKRHTAGFVLVIEANTTHGHIPPPVRIPRLYTDWN